MFVDNYAIHYQNEMNRRNRQPYQSQANRCCGIHVSYWTYLILILIAALIITELVFLSRRLYFQAKRHAHGNDTDTSSTPRPSSDHLTTIKLRKRMKVSRHHHVHHFHHHSRRHRNQINIHNPHDKQSPANHSKSTDEHDDGGIFSHFHSHFKSAKQSLKNAMQSVKTKMYSVFKEYPIEVLSVDTVIFAGWLFLTIFIWVSIMGQWLCCLCFDAVLLVLMLLYILVRQVFYVAMVSGADLYVTWVDQWLFFGLNIAAIVITVIMVHLCRRWIIRTRSINYYIQVD